MSRGCVARKGCCAAKVAKITWRVASVAYAVSVAGLRCVVAAGSRDATGRTHLREGAQSPRLSPVERNRRRCEALDGLLRIRRTANLVCGGQVDLYGFGIMLWEMYTVRFHFARHCSLCTGP